MNNVIRSVFTAGAVAIVATLASCSLPPVEITEITETTYDLEKIVGTNTAAYETESGYFRFYYFEDGVVNDVVADPSNVNFEFVDYELKLATDPGSKEEPPQPTVTIRECIAADKDNLQSSRPIKTVPLERCDGYNGEKIWTLTMAEFNFRAQKTSK